MEALEILQCSLPVLDSFDSLTRTVVPVELSHVPEGVGIMFLECDLGVAVGNRGEPKSGLLAPRIADLKVMVQWICNDQMHFCPK